MINKYIITYRLILATIIYFMWFFIANRSFDLTIALINFGLSYMAATGILFYCGAFSLTKTFGK